MPVEIAELTLSASPIQIALDGVDPASVRVRAFRGTEAMNRLFSFHVEVRTPSSVALDRALLGARARLTIAGAGFDRKVFGIVTRVRWLGAGEHTDRRFEIRLSPRAWLLSQRRNTRVFQDKTVPEIVAAILSDGGVRYEERLTRRYPKRTYCVQYDETGLAFVERLLAEEGIFYFFCHDDEEEMLVLGDAAGAYAKAPGDAIPLRQKSMQATDDHVVSFMSSCTVRPGRATLREFDFTRPALRLTESADVGEASGVDERELEVFDHYDELESGDVTRETAAMHLDAYRRHAATFQGGGPSRRLAPGTRISLDWAQASDVGDDFVLTSCKHVGTAPDPDASAEGHPVYDCAFRAVPGSTRYRPVRPRRRAQQTLETATVVGPKDDEIHVDEFGRIKVQFHWDREGKDDERSSCWLRVMQPWAGTGWGCQFIPRVGMEVIVQFITGDTDKPIVLGAVYNAEHPLPFGLPTSRTKSGIRTRSTPRSAGHNELSFDDDVGNERVLLRAERHFHQDVRGVRSATIGTADVTNVAGNSTVVVGRNAFTSVQMACSITAAEGLDLAGFDTTVVAHRDARLSAVEGKLKLEAGGDATLDARQIDVTARDRISVSASALDGNILGHVAACCSSLAFAAQRASLLVPNIDVQGSVTITGDELVITMGASTLKMNDDGIEIRARKISIRGDDKLELFGHTASLSLDGDVEAIGTNTTLHGSGSTLELNGKVSLKGSLISLGSAGGKSNETSDDEKAKDAEPPVLELSVYVGIGKTDGADGYLVIRDGDGDEIERRPAAKADRVVAGHLVFELDPDDYEGMIEVVYETGDRVVHVLGPASAKELRDDLVGKRVASGDAKKGHRPPQRAQTQPTARAIPRGDADDPRSVMDANQADPDYRGRESVGGGR